MAWNKLRFREAHQSCRAPYNLFHLEDGAVTEGPAPNSGTVQISVTACHQTSIGLITRECVNVVKIHEDCEASRRRDLVNDPGIGGSSGGGCTVEVTVVSLHQPANRVGAMRP